MNQTVVVNGLTRAAVANSKLLTVRAIPPNKLLMTGKHAGKTMVRAWTNSGQEQSFDVTVLPTRLYESSMGRDSDEVVKVALEFIEVDTSDSENFGIRWPDIIEASAAASIQGTINTTGLNYVGNVTSTKAWIEQLMVRGWARILARPSLYVRLGEQVVFHSGGEFPINSLSEKYGIYHRTIEWKPFGLTVKIRPDSGDSLNLSSEVDIEISERDASVNAEGVPSLTKRNLVTKMNSKHGETVVLTGLVRQLTTRFKEGTPWLSSIPILGWLFFSRNRKMNQQSEVLMAMTLSFRTYLSHEKELNSMLERLENATPP